jgi:hypothetical protein
MKFNWGTGITIFIILFFVATVSFVVFTTTVKFNLVEEDYYPKGLKYDEQRLKIAHTTALAQKVKVILDGKNLFIQFPDSFPGRSISGKVHIYRPSDETLDKTLEIAAGEGNTMAIPVNNMTKGKYLVKIDWQFNKIDYYQEETVILQ